MKAMLRSKSTFFGIGILVGISGFWGALSLGHNPQNGDYVTTLPTAVLPAKNATTTSGLVYPGTSIVWKGDTDSSQSDYQLERAACCPGEAAK